MNFNATLQLIYSANSAYTIHINALYGRFLIEFNFELDMEKMIFFLPFDAYVTRYLSCDINISS